LATGGRNMATAARESWPHGGERRPTRTMRSLPRSGIPLANRGVDQTAGGRGRGGQR